MTTTHLSLVSQGDSSEDRHPQNVGTRHSKRGRLDWDSRSETFYQLQICSKIDITVGKTLRVECVGDRKWRQRQLLLRLFDQNVLLKLCWPFCFALVSITTQTQEKKIPLTKNILIQRNTFTIQWVDPTLLLKSKLNWFLTKMQDLGCWFTLGN